MSGSLWTTDEAGVMEFLLPCSLYRHRVSAGQPPSAPANRASLWQRVLRPSSKNGSMSEVPRACPRSLPGIHSEPLPLVAAPAWESLMSTAHDLLRERFGFDRFRPGQ